MPVRVAIALAILIAPHALAQPTWVLQSSVTTERLRGVSAVDGRIVWASGNRGTCIRTIDGGLSWTPIRVPNSAGLDFRDLHAVDEQTAYLLAIGAGELSRILKTSDGGRSWVESYRNQNPKGFLDAIAFWDSDHGIALGDPVEGRFSILVTDDGGKRWRTTSTASAMPTALSGEGAFAASGTCLVVGPEGLAWFGTGGGSKARVFRSQDRGRSWSVADSPLKAGEASSGIFSLAFRDRNEGVAVGGDYRKAEDPTANLGESRDGGATWKNHAEAGMAQLSGFRSAVAYLSGHSGPSILAVGPSGTDLSVDGGRAWRSITEGGGGWHALSVEPSGHFAWAVGESGRVARLDIDQIVKAR